MSDDVKKENSIDTAIEKCEQSIKYNRRMSFVMIIAVGYLLAIPIAYLTLNSRTEISLLNDKTTSYVLYGFLVFLIGVFITLYRYHLKEVGKYEHFQLGFMRIRIAANNTKPGFQTEVRQSLTDGAFSYENSNLMFKKEKKVESPMPGHPTSDMGTAAINKILDSIEIVAKKDTKTER